MLSSISKFDNIDHTHDKLCPILHPEYLQYRISSISADASGEERYQVPSDLPGLKTFQSSERHTSITPEAISEMWQIGVAQARKTIQVTTQRGVRSAIMPMARRYRSDRMFQQRRLWQRFYTDTMFASHKSINGNTCAQIFANESFFATAYPMRSKAMAGQALGEFINDFGIPSELIMDGASEQVQPKTEMMRRIKKYDIKYHLSEPERYNQNRAEAVIREIKKKWFRICIRKKIPKRLWDYTLRWVCEIMQRTANTSQSAKGRVALEQITGETPDISEYIDFGFYDYAWCWENAGLGERQLVRWLGISHKVGSQMCYFVIKANGQILSRTSVQRVTNLEMKTSEVQAQMKSLDAGIEERLSDEKHVIQSDAKEQPTDWRGYNLDFDEAYIEEFHRVVSDDTIPEADEQQQHEIAQHGDNYIGMEVALPSGSENGPQLARVKKRLRDEDGKPIGKPNSNPLLDTRMYEIEYLDGQRRAITANQIADNLFAQIDDEGNRHVLLDEIIDHRSDASAVTLDDAMFTDSRGRQHRRRTTKGWELLIQWKDGSTNWIALKDVKNSYPIQAAEYAVANKISKQPAFAWWCDQTLRHKKRIISKVKGKYWLRTHKFGIRVPHSVQEAYKIDAENGNSLWRDAIAKEMENVRPAFRAVEGGRSDIPNGYQEIKCHMIFDIKMSEDFRRKARFVAGGHMTETPAVLTYSSVVSRDSVRIGLLIAALNDLDVQACDIQNAYLTAKCRERIFCVAGPKFGDEAGEIMIVEQALYGLKSSGAAFRALLAETLHDSGFRPTVGDPDVHIRPAIKENGDTYYEMMMCYVDDVLCISHTAKQTMKDVIQSKFKLKNNTIQEPDMYLGAQLQKRDITGQTCWTMTSNKYIESIIKNAEERLKSSGSHLPTNCITPLKSGYRPELDTSEPLKSNEITAYQEIIGELRWAVELGRIDIHLEVTLMSSFLASPRTGHLEQVYHIMGYLKKVPKKTIAIDPRRPDIDEARFVKHDWYDFYRDAKEPIADNMPKPRGKHVSVHCFVDASHADNKVNRRSQTGILIFVNRAPIMWYSKRQNTCETSTFGSEFIALKTATEMIQGLRFKLRSFGIPIDGPTDVFCDNEAVTKASRNPSTTLAKKHNAVAFHKCREAVAMGMIRVAHEPTKTNISDLLTKTKARVDRERLIDAFMY